MFYSLLIIKKLNLPCVQTYSLLKSEDYFILLILFDADYCNMCTCSGNGTQERAVQDLLCLVDLYLVYLI